jgi:transcription factor TGA
MVPPGVATADDARFCMPWATPAHFENWGDSGIVVTSPLAETASTDVDDVSGGNHHHDAHMVCSARL